MREILFRGKRTDNGKWVEGDYAYSNTEDKHYIICDLEMQSMSYEENDLYALEWYEVIPETVGQYTGLTDKNGVKIFEGDICKSIDGISLISYDNEMAGFVIRYFDYPPDTLTMDELVDDAEVIGNIHDNPELIGGVDNG